MDLVKKYAPEAAKLSIRQFCQPRCFELAERTIRLAMDSGAETGEVVLCFKDEDRVEWSVCGGAKSGESQYYCHKSDDYTYLVSFCSYEPRENFTFVIDREQELATMLHCTLGENPYYPYLIESHFSFGYIILEGKPHTGKQRHGFTDECTGTGLRWVYGHDNSTVHVYHSSNWYRIAYSREGTSMNEITDDPVSDASAAGNRLRQAMRELPSSDEPAYYVKIKEGMYLVSITEQNMEKYYGAKVGFRSDTLCFLDNWHRLYSVGRAYGTMTINNQDNEMFFMIGKYGKPEEIAENFFTDPIPYLV
ncbi:MAG: MoaF N-terminal domain-containing protein [Oscillospiraceae bacterium]|nr:MoaF N-terminal domain-containing protein [Oscillospiraceae bacterium]